MSDQIPQIGQRALAAIVFTDVVKFSSLASEDEQHALELMERDIKVMEEIVPKHEGIVLKKLGDGLLIYFSSAVQAVTCAEDIQRAFAENSILYPPAERMQHRIGIHLGDVFIKENDVMGDGVNVAARLQAEAEPNGICISQTVYDVVKNQLALQTAYLGQKDLKNIKNPVPVYRILVSGNEHAESSELNGSSSSWLQSNWKLIAALVGLALVLWVGFKLYKNHHKVATLAQTPSKIKNDMNHLTDDELNEKRKEFLKNYDFAGFASLLSKQDPPVAERHIRRYDELEKFKTWIKDQLNQATEQNPISFHSPSEGGDSETQAWKTPDGKYVIQSQDGQKTYDKLESMDAETIRNMTFGAMRTASFDDPRERRKIMMSVFGFSQEYDLPMPQRRERQGEGGPNQRFNSGNEEQFQDDGRPPNRMQDDNRPRNEDMRPPMDGDR